MKNNLVLIREKIKRAKRLAKAKLLATKNGEFTTYKQSVFIQRQKKAKNDLENNFSLNLFIGVLHPFFYWPCSSSPKGLYLISQIRTTAVDRISKPNIT